MSPRDPHDVLGVPRDASQTTIKAAWRRLAREHHPDLTAGDAAAARRATRRMAEINAAYEELRVGHTGAAGRNGAGRTGAAGAAGAGPGGGTGAAGPAGTRPRPSPGSSERTKAHAPGGAPRPRPGRPVTGRVDLSGTFRPHEHPSGPGRAHPLGQQPQRSWKSAEREPLRASDPTGPLERSRMRRFRPPAAPSLGDALATPVAFGKFHGHTLGEIAAFEPSYIDWLAATITRDRELVAAARVVRDDLDARGVVRVRRAERIRPRDPSED